MVLTVKVEKNVFNDIGNPRYLKLASGSCNKLLSTTLFIKQIPGCIPDSVNRIEPKLNYFIIEILLRELFFMKLSQLK